MELKQHLKMTQQLVTPSCSRPSSSCSSRAWSSWTSSAPSSPRTPSSRIRRRAGIRRGREPGGAGAARGGAAAQGGGEGRGGEGRGGRERDRLGPVPRSLPAPGPHRAVEPRPLRRGAAWLRGDAHQEDRSRRPPRLAAPPLEPLRGRGARRDARHRQPRRRRLLQDARGGGRERGVDDPRSSYASRSRRASGSRSPRRS